MSKDAAVIDAAEQAYAVSAPTENWLQEIILKLQPALDSGSGIFGWLYDARDFKNIAFSNPVFLGVAPELPVALVNCSQDAETSVSLIQRHYRTPAGPFSTSLGDGFAGFTPWRRHIHPLGVKDLLVVNGIDANRKGCAISAPRRGIAQASAERLALLRYFSVHLATAYRLRRRIDASPAHLAGPAHPRVEAVLSSSGRLDHASSKARHRDARDALSVAVRAAERARGKLRRASPGEAISVWKTMVSGRWSLSDHFESDGRRYILAYVNTPDAPPLRTLSELERQVLSCSALGKSNKLISHELGLGLAAVSSALKRATSKLGARRPRDLIAIMDQVLEAPVADES